MKKFKLTRKEIIADLDNKTIMVIVDKGKDIFVGREGLVRFKDVETLLLATKPKDKFAKFRAGEKILDKLCNPELNEIENLDREYYDGYEYLTPAIIGLAIQRHSDKISELIEWSHQVNSRLRNK